ncbi:CDC48, partial [Symbiodinium sp. KB8]
MAASGDAPSVEIPGRFTVVRKPDADTIEVFLNSDAMDEKLEVFEGDYVEIIGKKRRSTIAMVAEDDELADTEVGVPEAVLKNLGVKEAKKFLGVTVRAGGNRDGEGNLAAPEKPEFLVVKQAHPRNLTRAELAVVEGTLGGIPMARVEAEVIAPYFAEAAQPRVIKKGDLVLMGRGVWVKVTAVTPNGGKDTFGKVITAEGPEQTTVQVAPQPISQEESEADLNAVGYSDVGGLREQLHRIRETVELPFKHPKLFSTIGVKPPKGVLMHGPPGCGKTLIARAIANECGATFYVINGPEIISGGRGEAESKIKNLFSKAEAHTRDENMRRVVTALLTAMDGLKAHAGLMVIAATNRPNSLDMALRRAGRFDTEIVIPVPSRDGRLEILEILTKKTKLVDVRLGHVADVTHGYVGADLQALCMKAAIHAIHKHTPTLLDLDEDEVPQEFMNALAIRHEDFLAAMDKVTPSLVRDVVVETPQVSFDDIGGLEGVKQELRDMVELPVNNPEFYAEMGVDPPSGALLYGPPGTGKTLLAKASPCILFFDEVDSIAQQRGGSGAVSAGGVGDRIVNQLLTEIDGVGGRKNLFVMGATNRPDQLDSAFLRAGRLSQLIYVPMPDFPARVSVLRAVLRKTRVHPSLDIDKLAEATDGFSGADIAGLVQMAVKISVRQRLSAMERGEDTSLWAVQPSAFEIARSNCGPSISGADLASYEAARQRLADRQGGATQTITTDEEASKTAADGRFTMRSAGLGGAGGNAVGGDNGDEEDLYDCSGWYERALTPALWGRIHSQHASAMSGGPRRRKLRESDALKRETWEMEAKLRELQAKVDEERAAAQAYVMGFFPWGAAARTRGPITTYAKDLLAQAEPAAERRAQRQVNLRKAPAPASSIPALELGAAGQVAAAPAPPSARGTVAGGLQPAKAHLWSTGDVGDWLASLGLAKYVSTFAENEVSGAVLLDVGKEDLDYLEVKALAHRKLLLKAIARLATAVQTGQDEAAAAPTPRGGGSRAGGGGVAAEAAPAPAPAMVHWSQASSGMAPAAGPGVGTAAPANPLAAAAAAEHDEEAERSAFKEAVMAWRRGGTAAPEAPAGVAVANAGTDTAWSNPAEASAGAGKASADGSRGRGGGGRFAASLGASTNQGSGGAFAATLGQAPAPATGNPLLAPGPSEEAEHAAFRDAVLAWRGQAPAAPGQPASASRAAGTSSGGKVGSASVGLGEKAAKVLGVDPATVEESSWYTGYKH